MAEWKAQADNFLDEWNKKHHGGRRASMEELIEDYWNIVETGVEEVDVEYGNDIDSSAFGSGFPVDPDIVVQDRLPGTPIVESKSPDDVPMFSKEWYERCAWNLNNLPAAKGSLLRSITTPINGVNVPWVYMGMLFSTFCWHNEDNYLSSISYLHHGATKVWYGVEGVKADKFEKVVQSFASHPPFSNDRAHCRSQRISYLNRSERVLTYSII